MENNLKKNTKESLINYFKGKGPFKELGLNLLDKHYSWSLPKFFYEGSPLKMSGSNFSKNVKIKHKLHEIWQKEKNSRKNIVRWIIKDWGGIKGNKDSTLNFYNIEANKNSPATPYKGIASFSKVLSIRNPYEYAIYDARVAVSLNAIQLIENISEGSAFPYLSGRNNITGHIQKKIGFSNQKESAIKTLTNNPYNWSKISEENVYSYYIHLLGEIAKELRCPLYELEMSLFSDAEKLACIFIPSLFEHNK